MTVPSVSLADATLYGSFRTGLVFTSGGGASDADVMDFGSRFGIRGSSEVSEGLTASFLWEHGFSTATAAMGSGRHGTVGLSGGFGSITLGQTNSATQNHFSGALNLPWWYGVDGHKKGSRQARMISYSSSVGAVGFQIARYTDTKGTATIDFGASTVAGPVSVGVAHSSTEDYEGGMMVDPNDNKLMVADPNDPMTPKMSFTGFVVSAGLAGMNLAVGVGSTDTGKDKMGTDVVDESQTDVNIVTVSGSIADSGVSYAVQIADSDMTGTDDMSMDPSQNVISLTSVLGGGASLVFEHYDPKEGDGATLIGLVVDF